MYASKIPGHIFDCINKFESEYIPDYAVIRCIDSNDDMVSICNILNKYNFQYSIKYSLCVVNAKNMIQCNFSRIFNGFDELWFFDTIGNIVTIPDDVSLTSDGTDLTSYLDKAVVDVFLSTGCTLAMGDGCGVNYITNNIDIHYSFSEIVKG